MNSQTNPLENILSDGGYCGIFRTVGCIGDSLSSGEHESRKDGKNGYHDYFEYSWGQYMARACGMTVYNFSQGGMSAKYFIENQQSERLNISDPDKKCQAYIIALGVNDMNQISKNDGSLEFGSIDDVYPEDGEKNPCTFAGYMGKIISKIKSIEPKARVFLMTMPRSSADEKNELRDRHSQLMYQLSQAFEFTYVLDFRKYAPIYDDEFRKLHFLGGHMSAAGYLFTAKLVMTYIDRIIRDNPQDFVQVAFIGRENDLHNENYKW